MADFFGAAKNVATLGQYDRSKKALAGQSAAADTLLKSTLDIASRNAKYGVLAQRPKAAPNPMDDYLKKAQADSASLSKQVAALLSQIEQRPRLPQFDYAANMAKARGTAASTVNPVYQDKLNRYLEKQKVSRNQETVARQRNKQDIATSLTQSIEDIALNRGRTNEDATNKITDITNTENSWQRQEGRQFDQAREALLGNVAEAGLTESGLGQGTIQNAVTDRNLASADQVREYDTAKRDTEIFRTRTLADLDSTETRERGGATRRTENEDIALRDFIEMQGVDERDTRANLEMERTSAIDNAAQSAYQKLVASTKQSLAQSGARAQDIALFEQVYG